MKRTGRVAAAYERLMSAVSDFLREEYDEEKPPPDNSPYHSVKHGNARATCVGRVRGCCGTVHCCVVVAVACINRDDIECRKGNGPIARGVSHSDRRIVTAQNYTLEDRDLAGEDIMAALEVP